MHIRGVKAAYIVCVAVAYIRCGARVIQNHINERIGKGRHGLLRSGILLEVDGLERHCRCVFVLLEHSEAVIVVSVLIRSGAAGVGLISRSVLDDGNAQQRREQHILFCEIDGDSLGICRRAARDAGKASLEALRARGQLDAVRNIRRGERGAVMEGMPRRDLERPARAVLGRPLAYDIGLDLEAVVDLNDIFIDKAADELIVRIRRGKRVHAVALIAV